MTNALIRRTRASSQRLAIPPEVRRRNNLSFFEWIYAYGYALVAFPLCLAMAYAIDRIPDAWAITMTCVVGVLIAAWFVGAFLFPWGTCRQRIVWDRNRRLSPHADVRQTRMTDVSYNQYSVWPTREGDALVLKILEHHRVWWSRVWRSTATKKHYNQSYGSWSSSPILEFKTRNPTYEEACAARDQGEEAAEALEEKSYQENLSRTRIDRLVLVTRRPPATAKELRSTAADEMETFMDEVQGLADDEKAS